MNNSSSSLNAMAFLRLRVPSAETGPFFRVGFESIIKFGSLALGYVGGVGKRERRGVCLCVCTRSCQASC